MRTSPDGFLVVDPAECKITLKHLSELPKIMELLSALNDPLAGGKNVGKLVSKIPVLAARLVDRALSQSRKKEIYSIDQAINMIGNRGLESELLSLLEDLTIKKAEAEDPR
jgi:HD-like signal output (HDOD) protein